jgi:hypothetical protein
LKKEKRCKAKGYVTYSNKIVTENFPNLEKILPIQVQENSRTSTDLAKIELPQNRTSPWHITIKTTSTENRKIIDGCKREKNKKHINVNPTKL